MIPQLLSAVSVFQLVSPLPSGIIAPSLANIFSLSSSEPKHHPRRNVVFNPAGRVMRFGEWLPMNVDHGMEWISLLPHFQSLFESD